MQLLAHIQLTSTSPLVTTKIAEIVASSLRTGDVVLLGGGLAAGKTYFVKSLVTSLRSSTIATSPTYSLVHIYDTVVGNVVHVDAYRIDSLREFQDLGLDDYIDESITIIEWGDKVANLYPSALMINFDLVSEEPNRRLISATSEAPRWQPLLMKLADLVI